MIGKSKSLPALFVGAAVFAALSYADFRANQTRAAENASCCQPGTSGGRLTLDPAMFNGPVREAYKVAQDSPALLAQLHCYCGCDRLHGHNNLLDCFRDTHGGHCAICVGEAIDAGRMYQAGTPVEQIRDALRARYNRPES